MLDILLQKRLGVTTNVFFFFFQWHRMERLLAQSRSNRKKYVVWGCRNRRKRCEWTLVIVNRKPCIFLCVIEWQYYVCVCVCIQVREYNQRNKDWSKWHYKCFGSFQWMGRGNRNPFGWWDVVYVFNRNGTNGSKWIRIDWPSKTHIPVVHTKDIKHHKTNNNFFLMHCLTSKRGFFTLCVP